MNRIVKLVVALVLATSGFLVAGGTMTGAQAQTEQRTVSSAPGTSSAQPRVGRRVVMKYKRVSRVAFKLRVRVTPVGRRVNVKLQYAHKVDGNYKKIAKGKMNRKGVAQLGRHSKVGYYRAVVKATAKFDRSYSQIVWIHRV